jgi:FkbM family methyltransferase
MESNMAFGRKLKAFVQRCVNVFGYRIEKHHKDPVKAPIDLLDLLLTKVSAERPDFFFVQIGANNGLTDDPVRHLVIKHRWRGVLVEPQPQVFQQLLKNYEVEKQLAFENAAIADKDGTARLFVADHQDETADLTVFASLKKDALIRGLDNPKAAGVQVQVHEVEVPALSVQTLLAKHRITKIDLLLTDVQGYDGEVVEQFWPAGSSRRLSTLSIATQPDRHWMRSIASLSSTVIASMNLRSTPSVTCRPRCSDVLGAHFYTDDDMESHKAGLPPFPHSFEPLRDYHISTASTTG